MSDSGQARVGKVLYSEEQIRERVRELARAVRDDYQGKDLLLVGVLKGALLFFVDLAREIDLPLSMDFMAIGSYGATTDFSGVVRIIKDLDLSLDGKHVLIVEDIVDTGLTLKYIRDNLANREPASIRICALLNKEKPRKADVVLDYIGFQCKDIFVVGYGLDYGELYRNLPYIAELEPY